MKSLARFFVTSFGLFLLGCTPSGLPPVADAQPHGDTVSFSPRVKIERGQDLSITAQAKIGDQTIDLEVATTPEQQAIGLMYRSEIAPNRGMLFPFNPPRTVTFWMKNVEINLDMIFLRDGEVLAIADDVPPCTSDPCPFYGPENSPVDHVLELGGGRAAELGIQVGDQIAIDFLE
ncbi:DUF192 domain-containing protein [Phormidium pseudopriestleyi FRX01]|uniref:DUF192 domain-containing protein n=1 Tax=Phormidium pseudopriestleyi FRX01 TaxID=1759528 RepID=A0ABS3FT61_9CYAN|nr:DUF192 domain-containing protein [Phormidium pseudopriestleyi]MBO0350027.1 DUF192 domain-containing protein [Phormidium pseudopriestleyi FRX01]